MFCTSCGKELDANKVCINTVCPSNSEFEKETSERNNSTIENDEKSNNNQNAGFNERPSNNQNSDYNQNPGFNQNPNYNQDCGYNQNPNYNQNCGYDQNPNYNQNASYNQNHNYNQNAGYNQSYNYNQGNSFVDNNGISAGEMMEFLGPKNTEYYIDKWNKEQENPSFISWNWPAFLFNWIWLCFRKMYNYAAIVFVVSLTSIIILPGWANSIVTLAIMVASGLFANQVYIKHTIDKIRTIKVTTGMNPSFFSQRLRANGGITWVPVIIALVIFILIFIIVIIAGVLAASDTYYNGYGNLY